MRPIGGHLKKWWILTLDFDALLCLEGLFASWLAGCQSERMRVNMFGVATSVDKFVVFMKEPSLDMNLCASL